MNKIIKINVKLNSKNYKKNNIKTNCNEIHFIQMFLLKQVVELKCIFMVKVFFTIINLNSTNLAIMKIYNSRISIKLKNKIFQNENNKLILFLFQFFKFQFLIIKINLFILFYFCFLIDKKFDKMTISYSVYLSKFIIK